MCGYSLVADHEPTQRVEALPAGSARGQGFDGHDLRRIRRRKLVPHLAGVLDLHDRAGADDDQPRPRVQAADFHRYRSGGGRLALRVFEHDHRLGLCAAGVLHGDDAVFQSPVALEESRRPRPPAA